MSSRKTNEAVMMRFRNDLFPRAIDDIRVKRIKEGVDKIMRPRTEIVEAIARGLMNEQLESFRAVKRDLIIGEIKGKRSIR